MFGRLVHGLRRSQAPRTRPGRRVALSPGFEPLDRRDLPAVVVAPGFVESILVRGLNNEVSMAVAPDGRIFVGEKDGTIQLVQNDAIVPTPFGKIGVDTYSSQGLLGIRLDPDFEQNNFVYVYYVADEGGQQVNRLSRVTADGNTMVPGSEKVLFESQPFKIPYGDPSHDGGNFTFGADGKIYIPTGDLDVYGPNNSQNLNNVFGKVLRINSDGSIPTDNPFYNQTTGINKAIYAIGFRNPFTVAEDPATGRIYVNDVGDASYEEIDELVRGGNYGWPYAEGPSTNPAFTNPVYAYTHHDPDTNPASTAIIGGAFYNPTVSSFPSAYKGLYFFGDYANGWIKAFNPVTRQVIPFAAGLHFGVIGMDITPDGRLIYMSQNLEQIREIQFAPGMAPILPPLAGQTAPSGGQATFTANAAGPAPFLYQWQLNGVNLPGQNGPTLVLPGSKSLNGAQVRVVVGNINGLSVSNPATLTVSPTRAPVAQIKTNPSASLLNPGQTLTFSGTSSDRTIPASGLTWTVDLINNGLIQPGVYQLTGKKAGSFTIPAPTVSGNVGYRVTLTATNKAGAVGTASRTFNLPPI